MNAPGTRAYPLQRRHATSVLSGAGRAALTAFKRPAPSGPTRLPLPRERGCRAEIVLRPIGAGLPQPHQLLVGENADQDDRPHNGEIERAWDAEQIDEVLENLKQNGAEHDAEDRALAAAERTAAENRSRNSVKLIEIAVRGWRDRAGVHREEN